MNPTHQNAIVQAHAHGLTYPAIAEATGLSLSTVKRHAKQLGLGANGHRNMMVEYATIFVANEAGRRGMAVLPSHSGDRHALTINGLRVDVKAVLYNRHNACTFFLTSGGWAGADSYRYDLDHDRDADVLVLACCDGPQQVRLLYIKEVGQVTAKSITVGPQHSHVRDEERWETFTK